MIVYTQYLKVFFFQSQYLYLSLSIILNLVFLALIVFLIRKYKAQQKLLLNQDNILKKEQLFSQLKEKELKSILAMLKAQDEERLKIANELYDDLGSHMAGIKMHFRAMKDQDSKALFQKTDILIEEAYQKIRHIANAKHCGMLANQGLLKALQHMAKDISSTHRTKVSIYENDFNQRLENYMELSLFRIIQELLNNVIQHAKATEVDIHINGHDDTLNIMVEDNGRGFDASRITKSQTGIGLKSIDRRVENLEGKMIIESRMGVGTSVIIDLPI